MSTRRSHDVNRITGTHTLFLVISVVGLLRVVGLVVDGGVKIRAIQRADTVAAEARRAGGQAIRVPLAITRGATLAVARAAAAAAEAYLRTDGVTGDVVITTAAANSAWSSPARLPRCSSG
jgi:hypothetical protein